jgi:DHA1 family bicyclomycin/chloramphenicol resistance-like MFS transporter
VTQRPLGATPRAKTGTLIVLLACLSMLGALSTDTYLPSFGSMSREFGVGFDAIQQTLTVYLLAMAVMTLFHGTLSDAVGRRPVILWSMIIFTLSSLGAAFAPSLGVLLVSRFFQGVSAGAGMVVGRAMIRDLFDGAESQRVMSYTTVVFGLAPVVAPILGGWLEVSSGWRSIFLFMAAFVVVLLVACAWKLPESLPRGERSPLHLGTTLRNYAAVGSDPRFLLQSLSIALSCTALFLYISAAPAFVLKILHLPETAFAWLFIPLIAGIMIGSLVSARVASSWTSRQTISIGFTVMIASAVGNVLYCTFLPAAVPWAVVPIMLCTFGMALISPAMTVLTLDLHPKQRGLTSSLQSAFVMGGFTFFSGVLAPLLFGHACHLAWGALLGSVLSAACWALRRLAPVRETDA